MLQKHRESQQPLVMNGHQGDSQQEAGYLEPRSTVRRGSKPQYSPDSGVDVHGIQTDIPMEQLSWQPRAQFRHPQTRESVAVEGHEYEQLPGQRRQMTMYADIPDMNPDPTPSPPPLSKLPTPPGSRSTSMNDVGKSSNFDLHKPPSEQRRRENPLYDNMPEYKSMGSLMSDSHSPHRTKCLCVLAVLAVLLAIIAIVLGVLVFTIANTGNSSTLKPTASPVIDDSKIEALTKKIEDLETKLRLLEGSLGNPEQNASLATKVGSNSVYISDIQQNISQQQSVINEILKRGPSGAGDLSQCRLVEKEHGSNTSPTTTEWGPDLVDFDTYVTLGVHCTVSGGNVTYAKQREGTRNGKKVYQYQCLCYGTVPNENNRYCKLLYWQCPLVS